MQSCIASRVGGLVLWSPQIGWACSVCFSGQDETREAFTLTTIFLTLLPLLGIGGAVGWLWRRARQLEQASPAVEPHPAALPRG
jgi:hypothetical protein